MYSRKELKRKARGRLKKHYVLLTALCAIAIFFGTEFTIVEKNAQIFYDGLTDQITVLDTISPQIPRESVEKASEDIIDQFIESRLVIRDEEAAARRKALEESTDPHSVMARQRGALAALMNTVNSGQLTVTFWMALRSIIRSGKVVGILMILASTALTALVWIFLRNMYKAVLRRAALELRTYDALPLSHLLHFKMVRRWNRAALTLLLQSVLQWLWWLTLVGGIIKHYSYFMVPYIVAENPDIRPREAITLSRQMMNGHKWECFLLDLSFLGWAILGYFTFGALDILWTVPYRVASYSEYYALLREKAKESGIPGADLLNDDSLFAPAAQDDLLRGYADIVGREDLVDEDIVDLPPVRRFFARYFGIWTATLAEKKIYSRQEGLRQQMRLGQLELSGKAYPQRLCPLWQREAAAITGRVSYLTPCTVWSLIIIFFAFCMVGWIWEVSLHVIQDGEFVNRGVLHGPWLPIYGSGVAMITVLLYRFRRNPLLEGLSIIILCGIVEYTTSLVMENTLGMRWWDYTGYFLNLNGRICGEGLAVFALGGMAAVYLLVPMLDAAVTKMKPKVLIPLCLVLLICFFGDLVYSHFYPNSGEGITDYGQEELADDTWGNSTVFSGISFPDGKT